MIYIRPRYSFWQKYGDLITNVALVVLMFSVLLWVVGCGGGGGGGSSSSPTPAPSVVPLDRLVGYFGDDALSIGETKDHVNMNFIACWGENTTAQDLAICAADRMTKARAAGVTKSILALDSLVYAGAAEHPNVKANVRLLLSELRNANVLNDLVALYPRDEPDLYGVSDATAQQVNADIRAVAVEFGIAPKLAVTYSDHGRPGGCSYDWIAFDAYDKGTDVLNRYTGLCPGQETFVVPGGADPWRADPTPYVNWCLASATCRGAWFFLWVDGGDFGKGIRSNGMAPAYRAAAARISHP